MVSCSGLEPLAQTFARLTIKQKERIKKLPWLPIWELQVEKRCGGKANIRIKVCWLAELCPQHHGPVQGQPNLVREERW